MISGAYTIISTIRNQGIKARMSQDLSFDQLIKEKNIPVVAIDHNSMFIEVNAAFEQAYGWTKKELIGSSVTVIIPSYLRDAHQVGFSRFLITEEITLMGKRLPLEILYKDGTIRNAEHYIVGKKVNGNWCFVASIETK